MVPQILVGILVIIGLGGIYFGFKEISWRKDHEKSV
jgi:hypothetical protein